MIAPREMTATKQRRNQNLFFPASNRGAPRPKTGLDVSRFQCTNDTYLALRSLTLFSRLQKRLISSCVYQSGLLSEGIISRGICTPAMHLFLIVETKRPHPLQYLVFWTNRSVNRRMNLHYTTQSQRKSRQVRGVKCHSESVRLSRNSYIYFHTSKQGASQR